MKIRQRSKNNLTGKKQSSCTSVSFPFPEPPNPYHEQGTIPRQVCRPRPGWIRAWGACRKRGELSSAEGPPASGLTGSGYQVLGRELFLQSRNEYSAWNTRVSRLPEKTVNSVVVGRTFPSTGNFKVDKTWSMSSRSTQAAGPEDELCLGLGGPKRASKIKFLDRPDPQYPWP